MAVVVLAVGLLTFLSIRPMMPRQTMTAVATAPAKTPASQADAASLPGRGDGVGDASVDRAAPPPRPDAPSTAGAVLEPRTTASGEAATAPVEAAMAPGEAVAALGDAVKASDEAVKAPDEAVKASGEAATASGEAATASGKVATARAMPAAPELAHSTQEREARRAAGAAAPERTSRTPAPSSTARAPSPSPSRARHAAVGSPPSRGSPPRRPTERGSWLRELRAELDACQGNFLVRTICREKAKFRYCSPADAWGDVPECPSERPPDLATLH